MSSRPLPQPNADTRPFWDGCAAGELRYQCCDRCGQVQLIPRKVTMTYRVSGDPALALDHIAPAIDGVLMEQFSRLTRYADGGALR